MFYDVSMDFKGNVANLHDKVLCTAECLANSTVGTFHVDLVGSIDGHVGFLGQVLPYQDYL